ncbi:MAG: hypothetical protein GY822_12800 [Deltaproteobacteria bacterium]|nr:hypothetical protein [Deltaproteobacteria bacterium]
MSIAVSDTRLIEGIANALTASKSLELTGNADAIRNIAVRLLQENYDALKAAIAKEDKQQVEALEATLELSGHRLLVDEAFSRLYLALHSGVLLSRIAGDADPSAKDLSHYLNTQNPSSFAGGSLERALSGLERARQYADKYVPESLKEDVTSFVDNAIEKGRAAKAKVTSEKADAIQSLSRLEQVREAARERYLSARDLMSAAFREARQHAKLGQIMPGVYELLGSRRSKSADAPKA